MRHFQYIFLLLLASCMVGPRYKTPQNNVPESWQGAAHDKDTPFSTEEPLSAWWDVFEDPLLSKYIRTLATRNKDVLIAEASILQARALRKVSAANLFPQVIADLNATKTYFSKNGPVFAIGQATGNPQDTTSPVTGLPFQLQVPQTQPLYNALFDASWEIDLFGKTRRGVEAADAYIGSAIERRNDLLISSMAELASTYMEIRAAQRRAQLAEKNIHLLEEIARIIHYNVEKGLDNSLDEEALLAELAQARAALPHFYASIYQGIYALSFLTGDLPETHLEEMLPYQKLPPLPPSIAVGLRSDLLRRRPDVREKERELAAATALVGVAVASFFPTVTLLGDAGLQSLHLKNLFEAASKTWAVGGDIAIPVFQGGQLVGNLRASRAAAEAATLSYQQTVLKALGESETALIFYSQDLKVLSNEKQSVQHTHTFVRLSKERYLKGLVNKIDFLQSQRELVRATDSFVEQKKEALVHLIALYKALGGGYG